MKKFSSIGSEILFAFLLIVISFLFFFSFLPGGKGDYILRATIGGVLLTLIVTVFALGMRRKDRNYKLIGIILLRFCIYGVLFFLLYLLVGGLYFGDKCFSLHRNYMVTCALVTGFVIGLVLGVSIEHWRTCRKR